jgi:DNA polymerase, archaea type
LPYIWTDSTWTRTRDGRAEVVLFGRDYNDKYRTVRTVASGFVPYFYVPANSKTGERRSPAWHSIGEDIYTDALGRPVRQAITRLPSDIPKCREYYEFTDEADILFDKRFVVDNNISYAYTEEDGVIRPCDVDNILPPRIAFFDIEVRSTDGSMPKPEHPTHPIVSIQILDSYTDDIIIFTYDMPHCSSDQVACSTEDDMLTRFAEYIRKVDYDVLCGWYSNKFDIPYIIRRAQLLDSNITGLSRLGRTPDVTATKNGYFIRISGRQCFDFYDAFKKYYAPKGQLESYGLKDVISNKSVMKDAAYSYTDYGGSIVELFAKEDWSTFLQYCRNDVIALRDIDNTLKLVEFYEHLRKVTGVKLEETLLNSRVIESIIMRDGIKPMPSKRYSDRSAESFEGATVLLPPAGIHNNTGVVDLASLYPTIMVGFDISPDVDHTIVHSIKKIMLEREKLRDLNKTEYATDVTRNKEQVMKFLANSFYGVIGWDKFRLYNVELAAKVTRIGRELNEYLQSIAKDNGYTVLYGDTDSIFVNEFKSLDEGLEFERICNERLREWGHERGSTVEFTLKFEKLYRRILFKQKKSGEVAKKRYAGHLIWKDHEDKDELSTTGMETKRSDQSSITKGLLTSFLKKCLIDDTPDEAIKEIRQTIKRIRAGQVSIHDVSIPRSNNDPSADNPWAHGVKNLESLFGINIDEGAKPRLIYLKGDIDELCITNDTDEQLVRSTVEIDWDECCNKTVVSKMRTYVESIGYKWDNVIYGQQTLSFD